MKIVFVGGGTGGHFYPLIAVAEALHDVVREEHLIEPTLFYVAPDPYDKKALFENKMQYIPISAGKRRRYASIKNFFDIFGALFGIFGAWMFLFKEYPDVVFSKGGYASFPVVFAARMLRIPVVIHESDSAPGAVNKWSGKFAERVAISYAEAHDYFPKAHVALTGNPIRKELLNPKREGARDFLKLKPDLPVLLILGGSQGAEVINQLVVDMLPRIITKYQIIHQTGDRNIEVVKSTSASILKDIPEKDNYRPYAFLSPTALRMAAGATDLVITRAGSALFEIAHWALPSIIIPIPSEISHDQEKNAFAYARSGAGIVIAQANLNDDILMNQIEYILSDPQRMAHMSEAARAFDKPDAARKIAQELVAIGLQHEH